jgi:ribose 5-phosphate isomerase B
MRIAVSSDERTELVEIILDELRKRGHEPRYIGPASADEEADWPVVTLAAAEQVAQGEADEAVVMCWTGTGCTVAANKVPGVRAALCHDAETAKGARIWNHANVLALSLRATSGAIASEILDAWFATPYSDDEWNRKQMRRIREIEQRFARAGLARTEEESPSSEAAMLEGDSSGVMSVGVQDAQTPLD